MLQLVQFSRHPAFRGVPMLSLLCFLIAACQPGTAVEGLSEDPALEPIIVSLDLRTARTHYATDEAVLIESKGRTSNGQTVDAETEWLALDGGSVVEVSDGSKAMFSSSGTGTFRVVGRGKKKGQTSGGTSGGTSEPAPADTVALVVEPPPAPLASISVTPATDTVYRSWTQHFTVTGTRSDGSSASPAVTWQATGGSVDVGGYFTAPNTDGVYKVIPTTTDGLLADTASATVVVAPTNEPEGFTRIFENQFRALPFSSNAFAGDWSEPSGTMGLVTATTPSGDDRALKTTWPSGLLGGSSPGRFDVWDLRSTSAAGRYSKVYVSFHAMIPGVDFENQKVATKLFYIAYGNTAQTNAGGLTLGNGTGVQGLMREMPLRVFISPRDDREGGSLNYGQNINSSKQFVVGRWNHIEMMFEVGTPDQANGVVKAWIDGVLVMDHRNVKYLDSDYAFTQGIYAFQWTPVWGGTGGERTRDDSMLMDALYASGIK